MRTESPVVTKTVKKGHGRRKLPVEHDAKKAELDAAKRKTLRQEKSDPLLASLKEWLDQVAVNALPKSPLGQAITYARNQWAALNVYTTNGGLAIDNKIAERAIKPLAIGRKNWLFFGSGDGGQRIANFTATCQQLGLDPWTWLKETLVRFPLIPLDQLAMLLPSSPEK